MKYKTIKEINLATETESQTSEKKVRSEMKVVYRGVSSAPIYGFGFIGALIYYIQIATSFWMSVLGFFKALDWPAMLVYELMQYLSM